MKRFLILIICTIINALLFSQNHYYADGQQVYWTTDSISANIIVKNTEDYSQIVKTTNLSLYRQQHRTAGIA